MHEYFDAILYWMVHFSVLKAKNHVLDCLLIYWKWVYCFLRYDCIFSCAVDKFWFWRCFSLDVVSFEKELKLFRCVRIGRNLHVYTLGSSDTYMSLNADMYLSYSSIYKVL